MIDIINKLKSITTTLENDLELIKRSKSNYRFNYYIEYNDKEVLRNEVQSRLRDNKLKKILNENI